MDIKKKAHKPRNLLKCLLFAMMFSLLMHIAIGIYGGYKLGFVQEFDLLMFKEADSNFYYPFIFVFLFVLAFLFPPIFRDRQEEDFQEEVLRIEPKVERIKHRKKGFGSTYYPENSDKKEDNRNIIEKYFGIIKTIEHNRSIEALRDEQRQYRERIRELKFFIAKTEEKLKLVDEEIKEAEQCSRN